MAHALEAHAFLVNETLGELQANAELLLHLEATCSPMEKELAKLEQQLDYASETHWLAWSKMDEAFQAVELTLSWLWQFVKNLGNGLAAVEMERLPPTLFPPIQLREVLREVRAALPHGWSLVPSLQAGDLWRTYKDARAAAAASPTGLRIFIHLPVFEFPLNFLLFRVTNLPKVVGNDTLGARFHPLPDYLAVSMDRQTFIELTAEELQSYATSASSICPISRSISRKKSRRTCAAALFLQDPERIQAECT